MLGALKGRNFNRADIAFEDKTARLGSHALSKLQPRSLVEILVSSLTLIMRVRALGWIRLGRDWSLDHFDFEGDRQLFRRKAGSFIAGLILQSSANLVLARQHAGQRAHLH